MDPITANFNVRHFKLSSLSNSFGNSQLPLIIVESGIGPLEVLLDSGSEINCMNDEVFASFINKKLDVLVLPVMNVGIRGATGRKACKIKKRVEVLLHFCSIPVHIECYVVPNLISPILLGSEFFWKYSATLDYNTQTLNFSSGDEQVKCEFRFNSPKFINFIKATNREINQNEIHTKISDLLINSEQKQELLKLLSEFTCLFKDTPGLTDLYSHKINMKTEQPFVRRSYPIPFALRPAVDLEIEKMEKLGVIERSASPFSSPITIVKKKDGSIRICLDARTINSNMVNDIENPPPMDELIQKFANKKIFSIIDLRSSYWQIPLEQDSRKYTAFLYNGRSFVYKVLPFGLKTAVASFSRAMDFILGPEVREFTTNYIDDLLIASENHEQHIQHLKDVLTKLKLAKFTVNLQKTEFFKQEIKFLGHILTTQGIRPDPDKVIAIQNFPTPRKIKDLRAFLGLCNFYRKFQSHYAELVQQLTHLLRKNNKWQWGEAEEKVFKLIKEKFLEEIVLCHPDFSKTFILQTDCSDLGLGGVLFQEDEEKNHRVITFLSRALHGPEVRYTTTEKELLAVIYCLKKVRLYVTGRAFVIRTDHRALEFLKPQGTLNDRLTRWLLYLQNFDYTIEHVKGSENKVADILSRKPYNYPELWDKNLHDFVIAALPIKNKIQVENRLASIKKLQEEDVKIRDILEHCQENQIFKGCIVRKGVLFKIFKVGKPLIYLPDSLREEVITYLHEELGHAGVAKVYGMVKRYFYFPGVYRITKKNITSCDICQKAKKPNRSYSGELYPIIPTEPGALVAVDFFGPLPSSTYGATYLFVVLDVFSKYVHLYPLRKATCNAAIKKVLHFHETIPIRKILSDHCTQFTSKNWQSKLSEVGISPGLISVYHPQANPAERVMKEIGRMLRTYCNKKHNSWYQYISDIQNCFNSLPHESTGKSAMEIITGEKPPSNFSRLFHELLPAEPAERDILDKVRKRLRSRAERRKIFFDKKIKKIHYDIGDLVLVKQINISDKEKKIARKLSLLYSGPYKIIDLPFPNVVTLIEPFNSKKLGNYNFAHIKPYQGKA